MIIKVSYKKIKGLKIKKILPIRIGCLLVLVLSVLNLKGQDYVKFSQIETSLAFINPACNGLEEGLSGSILYRTTWESFAGAPKVGAFNASIPIPKKQLGIGISLVNSNLGPYSQVEAFWATTYKVLIDSESQISFGLQFGVVSLQDDPLKRVLGNPNDPVYLGETSYVLPNFGFGLHFYSSKHYIGFSIPKLIYNNVSRAIKSSKFDLNHLRCYLYGGVNFNANEDIEVKPSFSLLYPSDSRTQFEFLVMGVYKDVFGIGFAWRTKESLVFLTQIKISENLKLTFSYESTVSTSRPTVFNKTNEFGLVFNLPQILRK
ncbi:MAG: PorP/SprF family type IX secretion system membrane protein [Labilibaculum antarcticum]